MTGGAQISGAARIRVGVGARLLFAFLGISLFAVLAAAAGIVGFIATGESVEQITEKRVPAALSALELSREVERIVAAAPAILNAESEEDLRSLATEINRLAEDAAEILKRVNRGAEARELAALAVAVDGLRTSLRTLRKVQSDRLENRNRKHELLDVIGATNAAIDAMISPWLLIVNEEISNARERVANIEMPPDLRAAAFQEIDKLNRKLRELQAVTLTASLFRDRVNGVTGMTTVKQLKVVQFRLKKLLMELTGAAEPMYPQLRELFLAELGRYEVALARDGGLTDIQARELELLEEGRGALTDNAAFSTTLRTLVDDLVDRSRKGIDEARGEATRVREASTAAFIGAVALSLVSSILVVWLYVGRRIVQPLRALSNSMLAIAGGNLRAPLPATGGGDEISRMAEALVVFRDTAIEVEESNLREIEEAQRRLVDAIENSSEGFAFYDPDDKLVICNTRYKELLYPDADIDIEPGMAFEAIIRAAAEGGHILDAEGRVDEWVAERLEVHRNPGEQRLQRRGRGQWVMITERKTGDGGTVAIYSDITELKQREEELTKKSNALEQLSNQLAKYLSPQVYDSIFAGKQEVKLVSRRKRLTVFFSDLVGFTETTERLESEDLTRLLNQYLTEMSQIAHEHGATIDKFVGDAIVIFFGDPETLGVKEDALACVKMAIAMRKRMNELQSVWKDSGLEKPLQCRMGINTGVCTVGNFGSEDRMDYTIIGGGVNLAARLESACAPGEILISYETHAHVKNLVHCEDRDAIMVKGIAHPVTTNQVVDLYERLDDANRPIRASLPHFQLDVDLPQMSPEQKREALEVLLLSVERLSNNTANA